MQPLKRVGTGALQMPSDNIDRYHRPTIAWSIRRYMLCRYSCQADSDCILRVFQHESNAYVLRQMFDNPILTIQFKFLWLLFFDLHWIRRQFDPSFVVPPAALTVSLPISWATQFLASSNNTTTLASRNSTMGPASVSGCLVSSV